MKIRKKFLESISNIGAVLIIFIVLVNLSMHIVAWDMWSEILWYCDFAGLLLGIALLYKNNFLITAVLTSAIPAQFLWIVDFVLELVGHGMGRTEYMFSGMLQWNMLIFPVLLHSILIPLSLLGVILYGFNKRSIIFSVGFFVITLMSIIFFTTNQAQNINCVFFPCDLSYYKDFTSIISSQSYLTWRYSVLYIAKWSAIVAISHLILQKLFTTNSEPQK